MSIVPGVIDAFNEIRRLALQGAPFRMDQVFYEIPEESAATVFGTGYDFTNQLTISDLLKEGQSTPDTTTATTELRIIAAENGGLFLRQRLTWTPSDGKQHVFYACYQITPAAAEQLAATDLEVLKAELDFDFDPEAFDRDNLEDVQKVSEMLFGALGSIGDLADHYNAIWRQTVPGNSLEEDESSEEIGIDEFMAMVHDQHHKSVIEALAEAGTVVTCMLSDGDMGIVGPEELVMIAEWMRTQPQIVG